MCSGRKYILSLLVLLLGTTVLIYLKKYYDYKNCVAEYTNIDFHKFETTTDHIFKDLPSISQLAIGPKAEDYLLSTPHCNISNYGKTYNIPIKTKSVRELRAVTIEAVGGNRITFKINATEMSRYVRNTTYVCCYMFVRLVFALQREEYLQYTPCRIFKDGTNKNLQHEVIIVSCSTTTLQKYKVPKENLIYRDGFIILKNMTISVHNDSGMKWNVLLLGIESMSRARAYAMLPRTVQYFRDNRWLDYKAYQKTDESNPIHILTGFNRFAIKSKCYAILSDCSKHYLWTKFKNSGYITAYGEDTIEDLKTTNTIFEDIPTDHYMRTFYLLNNAKYRTITKKTASSYLLDYAKSFAKSYQTYNFFGTFWINPDVNENPGYYDNELLRFFKEITKAGVLDNTFVIFYSNQGIGFGDMRVPEESYYDERLPMLFISPPKHFRTLHNQFYQNMKTNQNRLVTPLDVHHFINNILTVQTSKTYIESNYYTSLFKEISFYRSCLDARVSEEWCTCHKMIKGDATDKQFEKTIQTVVNQIQMISKNIETFDCMVCTTTKLYRVLRVHTYTNIEGVLHHVVVLKMAPQYVMFESILKLEDIDVSTDGGIQPQIISLMSTVLAV